MWRIKIGSTVLYRHQPTTKELSKDPWSNNKIAKVGLISMISGRKLCAQLLNMNQTVLLVSRWNKILCMNCRLAGCLYWADHGGFYAATMWGRGAEAVALGFTTQLHRLFRCLWTRLQQPPTIPRKSPINTLSVSVWLSGIKSMISPVLPLFSTLSLVSFLKPDWNQSKSLLSPCLVPKPWLSVKDGWHFANATTV